MGRLTILLLALVAGCGEDNPTARSPRSAPPAGTDGVVVGDPSQGETRFAKRIDGVIKDRLALPGARKVLITNGWSGTDQCKAILISRDGERLDEYAAPHITIFDAPPGRPRTEDGKLMTRLVPKRSLISAFQFGGEHYITVGAVPEGSPSHLAVLRVTERTLEERFGFWNRGHIHQVAHGDSHLALVGVHQRTKELGKSCQFLAVFDLASILGGPSRTGRSPRAEDESPVRNAAFKLYAVLTNDRNYGAGCNLIEIKAGTLTASMDSGLRYSVDLATGRIGVAASRSYRTEYQQRRRDDPSLPAQVDEWLARLVEGIRVWSG